MSSPAVQLSFTLRTSPGVKTVHLLGSWDNYKSQLPLSSLPEDPSKGIKSGSWRGSFRFQGSHALKLGSRYWYYYIVDGYHVSHDPAKEFVTEKTTGRKLNIIDVPGGNSGTKDSGQSKGGDPSKSRSLTVDTSAASRHSREIPQGRALSPGQIKHPKPSKPYASRGLREADYETSPIDDLEERFAGYRISTGPASASPSELSDSSTSSGTAFSTSPSSVSSASDHACRCERYGVTKSGQRVRLDCGGKRCGGWSSSSSECTSESDESEGETEQEYRARMRKEAERKHGTSGGGGHSKSSKEDDRRREERRGERRVVVERRGDDRRDRRR